MPERTHPLLVRLQEARPNHIKRRVSNTMNTQSKTPTLATVVKKHSISSELAQRMADEAVAKARELGVTENVAILADGGNLKAFRRTYRDPLLCIEMAQTKPYPPLFGFSTPDIFT